MTVNERFSEGEQVTKEMEDTRKNVVTDISGINTKVVLGAREIIRKAEEKLCILVKDYFEENRNRRVEVEEEVLEAWSCEEFFLNFVDTIQISDWSVTVLFKAIANDTWVYAITCRQLGVERLNPPKESVAFQGELQYEFFCATSDEIEKTLQKTIKVECFS